MIADGVIFDVDGTFWDSTPVVSKAWNRALEECGYPNMGITPDRLKGLFGLPMDDILLDILPGESIENIRKVGPYVYRYEDAYLREESGVLYPELINTIKTLHESLPLFVVSNCQAGYIELFCEKTGLTEYFKDHLCPDDTGMLKADNIAKIIRDYDLKKPVYVGDTQMDADACKKAGCPIVFASYGFGKVKEPDYVIEKPWDLVELLK